MDLKVQDFRPWDGSVLGNEDEARRRRKKAREEERRKQAGEERREQASKGGRKKQASTEGKKEAREAKRSHIPELKIRTVLVYPKAVYFWYISFTVQRSCGSLSGYQVWVGEEEHVREGGPEVSSIQAGLLRWSRVVEFLTARAVHIHWVAPLLVRHPHWQAVLALAADPGASSELCVLVLVEHAVHAPAC